MWKASRYVLFSSLVWTAHTGAGQPPDRDTARIKVQSTSVVVDVIVTNKKGEPVTSLTAQDFKLFENEAPQKISSFEPPSVVRPVGSRPEAASAAAPSSHADSRFGTSHFIILVIDVAGLQQVSLQAALKAGTQYLDKVLSADDYVAIYWLGSTLHAATPFTRDKAKAIEALQNIRTMSADGPFTARERMRTQHEIDELKQRETQLEGQAAQGDPMAAAMAQMAQSERLTIQGNLWMQSTFQARAVFQALRAIAQASAGLPGRKNVVLFSEGFVHSPEAQAQATAVIDAANRADVAVYIVDPIGLSGGKQQSLMDAQNSSSFSTPLNSRGNARAPRTANSDAADVMKQGSKVTGGYTEFDMIGKMDDEAVHDDLSAIAGATGGYLLKNSNDPLHLLGLIDRDLREYYTLVYQPSDQTFDGGMRKIRVDAGAGFRLRYRKTYFAMPPGEEARMTPAAAQMLAGVANGSLKSTVASKMNAAALIASTGDASIPVSLWLPGNDTWVSKIDKDHFKGGASIVFVARDAQGHVAAIQQKFLELNMSKGDYQKLQSDGVLITASLSVPKLEAHSVQAILEFSNGAISIADAKAPVSQQDKSALTLSSLLLTPRVLPAPNPVDAANPLMVEGYQLVLPPVVQFSRTDKMTVYLILLNYPHTANGGLQFISSIAIKSGERVIRDLGSGDFHAFGNLEHGAFLLTQYDLAGLNPGTYTLEAKIRDLVQGAETVQTAPFSIQ